MTPYYNPKPEENNYEIKLIRSTDSPFWPAIAISGQTEMNQLDSEEIQHGVVVHFLNYHSVRVALDAVADLDIELASAVNNPEEFREILSTKYKVSSEHLDLISQNVPLLQETLLILGQVIADANFRYDPESISNLAETFSSSPFGLISKYITVGNISFINEEAKPELSSTLQTLLLSASQGEKLGIDTVRLGMILMGVAATSAVNISDQSISLAAEQLLGE